MPVWKVTGKLGYSTATIRVEAPDAEAAKRLARRRWRKGTKIRRVERV